MHLYQSQHLDNCAIFLQFTKLWCGKAFVLGSNPGRCTCGSIRVGPASPMNCPFTRVLSITSRARIPIAYAPCMSVRVRAYAFGQSRRHVPPVPIRTHERSSRSSGQMRFLFTQPRVTPKHARHYTASFARLYFTNTFSCPIRPSFTIIPILFRTGGSR